MPDFDTQARVVFTTTASREEAGRLARTLVEERLAACATILPSVESIYHWQGEVESASETLLLIKTSAELIPSLEARLHELHSYDTPEFLVLRVEAGSPGYLSWMRASVRRP